MSITASESVKKLNEERNENDFDYNTVAYNPNKSLSIEHQRLRLPIYNFKEHIVYLLEKYQVLVVVGETGCGKSTQLPQFLYEYGLAQSDTDHSPQIIGVTEPRRIAAISLATRIAEEMGVPLGGEVGYSIRFEECYDKDSTKIKLMTEGILIREMMNDPLLTNYSVIIVDEVHERSVNTDILLSLLKKIIRKRPELKLVISSATLETESILDYFNQVGKQRLDRATVICIDGRTFPVDIFYLSKPAANYLKESVDTVIKIHENFPHGDVLVFLTGQEEVEEVVDQLFNYARSLKDKFEGNYRKLFVLPFYASLPTTDQLKVFQAFPRSVRKVVVATNIAEASVTITGISFVVDCGFFKTRYFNPKTGIDSLVIVPITKASAAQRAGRAGRTKSGHAFRLYPETEYEKLIQFTPPEIERVALPSVILQLKALGINNVVKFDFLTPPPELNVISSFDILFALQAIDEEGNMTDPLGLQMAEFPLNPAFSKMLLVSEKFGCSEEILTITAILQVQNIFSLPGGGQRAQQARRAKHNLSVEEGDLITYLNVFRKFLKAGQIKSWSDRNYLHYKGLLRAVEIRNRLKSILRKFNIRLVSTNDVEAICKCIVAGFFTNAAQMCPDGIYRTIRGNHELYIHPTSVIFTMKRPPKFIVFTEVLHTTKEFMKDITAIKASWLYELAPHYYEFGTEREILERKSTK